MIPVPFIVLGIAATTLGARHCKKHIHFHIAGYEIRKNFKTWCMDQGLEPKSDGTIDLNAHLPNGNPLIIETVIQWRNDFFEFLIEQKVDVNAMNLEGKTALFYCKNCNQIEKLISAGTDVNARDLQGRTAIFNCKDVRVARTLLMRGADLLIQDENGKTVLHSLSTAENDLYYSLKFAQIYASNAPKLLNIVDNMGKKADICKFYLNEEHYESSLDDEEKKKLSELSPDMLLNDAVEHGKYKLTKIALERGANPKCRHRNQNRWNMLSLAVVYNNPHLIPLLVQYKADVNEKIDHISPLKYAIMDYHPECVKMLLDNGAKIDDDLIGMTKYCIHPEIYFMICKTNEMPPCEDIPEGVDFNKCSQSELNRYLISAVKGYDIEKVHRLLDAGADPNVEENDKSVLLLAAEKNAPEIIQILVNAGAYINKRFKSGTALNCACFYHQDKCVELLLELGAKGEEYDFDTEDNDLDTGTQYSLEHNACTRIREICKNYKSKVEQN